MEKKELYVGETIQGYHDKQMYCTGAADVSMGALPVLS